MVESDHVHFLKYCTLVQFWGTFLFWVSVIDDNPPTLSACLFYSAVFPLHINKLTRERTKHNLYTHPHITHNTDFYPLYTPHSHVWLFWLFWFFLLPALGQAVTHQRDISPSTNFTQFHFNNCSKYPTFHKKAKIRKSLKNKHRFL